MPVQGIEFTRGRFQDVRYLIEQTDLLYEQQIIPRGGPTKWQAAADRCIDRRNWRPSLPMIESNLEPIFRELNIFYVPKQLVPGPGFVFPKYDTTGEPTKGKFNPLGWELFLSNTLAKYAALGLNHEFKGPHWIGNSDRVLQAMIRTRSVVLVEGPWDLVACRVISPDIPTITPETKLMNEMHFQYLKALGVARLVYLFDNEYSTKREGAAGAGYAAQTGMSREARKYGFSTETLLCPKEDPSACLKDRRSALALKNLLNIAV